MTEQRRTTETITVPCSACRAENCVSVTALMRPTRCETCRRSLCPPREPIQADEPALEKIIHLADALVLVSIFDNRVGPSRMCAPDIYQVAREFQGSVVVVRLDANLCPNAAVQHRCGAGPYFMVLRHGDVVQ